MTRYDWLKVLGVPMLAAIIILCAYCVPACIMQAKDTPLFANNMQIGSATQPAGLVAEGAVQVGSKIGPFLESEIPANAVNVTGSGTMGFTNTQVAIGCGILGAVLLFANRLPWLGGIIKRWFTKDQQE